MLDKSIEDLTGKLKAEEAKRKELENRVKQLSNESQSTKTENKTEEKPASVRNKIHRRNIYILSLLSAKELAM